MREESERERIAQLYFMRLCAKCKIILVEEDFLGTVIMITAKTLKKIKIFIKINFKIIKIKKIKVKIFNPSTVRNLSHHYSDKATYIGHKHNEQKKPSTHTTKLCVHVCSFSLSANSRVINPLVFYKTI